MKALQQILEQYSNGTTIAVLDAPTGAGKTLIGELVHQYPSTVEPCTSVPRSPFKNSSPKTSHTLKS